MTGAIARYSSQQYLVKGTDLRAQNSPTAGDMEREPVDPVGDGVGLIPWELGVPGAGPLELSLLF